MTHTEFGIGSGHALQDEEGQPRTFTQLYREGRRRRCSLYLHSCSTTLVTLPLATEADISEHWSTVHKSLRHCHFSGQGRAAAWELNQSLKNAKYTTYL